MSNENSQMVKDYKAILRKVKKHMKWNDLTANHWYFSNNPNFGGTSPHQLNVVGRAHKVMKFIDAAIEENGP